MLFQFVLHMIIFSFSCEMTTYYALFSHVRSVILVNTYFKILNLLNTIRNK